MGKDWRINVIHARLVDHAMALIVDVDAAGCAGRLPVDTHAESNELAARARTHDQVYVPRVEAVGDLSARLLQHRGFTQRGPLAGKRPLVEPQSRGSVMALRRFEQGLRGRGETARAPVAHIGFRRTQVLPIRGGFGRRALPAR